MGLTESHRRAGLGLGVEPRMPPNWAAGGTLGGCGGDVCGGWNFGGAERRVEGFFTSSPILFGETEARVGAELAPE